jgi:prolyl-tRNA editing enzyme YbaK/EbsC (Cys-tRNA(Pro) deacylase)
MATIAGRKRKPWAIKEYLHEQGHSMSSVAKKIGVSAVQVRKTIVGDDDSQRVLSALVEMGCPIKLLGLPDSMKMKRVV